MLAFTQPSEHGRGIIADLLRKSYAGMASSDPLYWRGEEEEWAQFDRDAFENPETVGKCVFVSMFEDTVVGLGSFDPRQAPECGIVGHNCILPEFRGRGFGKLQIEEICARLRTIGCKRAVVSTGDHPFFVPAQRMYISCGFEETRRNIDGPRPSNLYKLIEYEKIL